jgi:homoaconitase/3-isopropylmalate dehydratase large subunit
MRQQSIDLLTIERRATLANVTIVSSANRGIVIADDDDEMFTSMMKYQCRSASKLSKYSKKNALVLKIMTIPK